MLLMLLLLLGVVLLFGLGLTAHVLWIVAAIALVLWILGLMFRPRRRSWLRRGPW
ncbi:MAG: hydrophobic protein [Candidatus Dormibacteraeota bacterium]|nr:hydrophobic protein [Candidatus Dormibacteraeota bacterium]